jgi:hypothetical protein
MGDLYCALYWDFTAIVQLCSRIWRLDTVFRLRKGRYLCDGKLVRNVTTGSGVLRKGDALKESNSHA